MMRTAGSVLSLALFASLASCGSITGGERHVGILDVGHPIPGAAPVLEAPDTVTAGQSFSVVVRTYGMGSCWRADGARVRSAASTTTITPYDRNEGGDCAFNLPRLERTVRVTLPAAGTATLTVRGRTFDAGGTEQPAQVSTAIHVR